MPEVGDLLDRAVPGEAAQEADAREDRDVRRVAAGDAGLQDGGVVRADRLVGRLASPDLALKASRTFWNDSCSLPPHREVTTMLPAAPPSWRPGARRPGTAGGRRGRGGRAAVLGAAAAQLQAARTRALVRNKVRTRSDQFIDHLRWVRPTSTTRARDGQGAAKDVRMCLSPPSAAPAGSVRASSVARASDPCRDRPNGDACRTR